MTDKRTRPRGWSKEQMALEVIGFFTSGVSVNLGIGLPTMIGEMIPGELDLYIQSENGVLGVAGRPRRADVSPTLINAGKETVAVKSGASFFDSALSFGMIRGGHIDFCVLGGMEADVAGDLANWMVPGQKVTGMGGAMDLVHGAKCVIVMMTHFTKAGTAKLVRRCSLPLTGAGVVHHVVTELGVFRPEDGKFTVGRLADGVSLADLGMETDILRVS